MRVVDYKGKVSNDKEDAILKIDDLANQKYIKYMCKTCKFYKDRCMKKRTVRECSVKFLKNKDSYIESRCVYDKNTKT